MSYFDKFNSNTLGAGGNQYFFINDNKDEIKKGRIFYKIFAKGEYLYSFLFSNVIDSTFYDGSVSHKNLVCEDYEIVSASFAICDECHANEMIEIDNFKQITFDGGKASKVVNEMFATDPIKISADKNQYLCLEINFKGRMIPYHEESILPIFVFDKAKESWIVSPKMPIPSMVGCNRKVKSRVGFVGDSITQGIGTEKNSYDQYSAVAADLISNDYSFWNLGLGYARGDDFASNGAWMFKAKQLDTVSVCFGVNDIFRGFTAEQIKNNLQIIVDELHKANVKVLIHTIPPFDYTGEEIDKWNEVNAFIRNKLSKETEGFFDIAPFLSKDEEHPYLSKYGSHPNGIGHRIWAENLAPILKKVIEM